MFMQLKDRVAIVTGAGGGLGRCHALYLAGQGTKVVVNDLTEAAAQNVVDEIVAAGGQAMAAAGSVTDVDAVQAMVEAAMKAWGRIDILINNAGILRDKSFSKMTLDDFRLVRSEEHTSELQSRENLVCRLLLEKKKQHRHR